MNLNNCTCGPYHSIRPPEPCPIHDPERAYWRMKLLQEFGGQYTTTTTTTAQLDSYKGDAFAKKGQPDPLVHYKRRAGDRDAICGEYVGEEFFWAGTIRYVTCKDCRLQLEIGNTDG